MDVRLRGDEDGIQTAATIVEHLPTFFLFQSGYQVSEIERRATEAGLRHSEVVSKQFVRDALMELGAESR